MVGVKEQIDEINAIKESISKEIDELWELQNVLSSVKTLIEFFTGVKEDAIRKGY